MDAEDDNKSSCIIASLQVNKFFNLSYEEQCRVIAKGRPRPDMVNLVMDVQKGKEMRVYTRHFNPKEYDKYPWLTGSELMNKLFCWPCVLFRPCEENNTWSHTGYSNLCSLSNALLKHASSKVHILNSVRVLMFVSYQQNGHLKGQNQLEVSSNNEGVARNREILRRLVNAICYLVKTGSSICGQNEDEAASNGQYAEYLTLTAISELDPLLGNHLALSTSFQSSSNQIQHDLIQAIGNVVLNQIKQELSEARYVAIILETLDTMNVSWLTTVLRYANDDGVVFERFVGFTDLSSNKTAVKGLLDHVTQVIEEFNIQDKLVAQAYDGAVATVIDLSGLMQVIYPKALYMHSCARLNLILQKLCARSIKECKLFFTILSGLQKFFLNSPKRKNALDMFMAEKLPKISPSSWDLSVRVVDVVSKFLPQLIQFFEHVIDNPDDWDEETIIRAQGYPNFLQKFSNVFLIVTFGTLFSHTQKLDNVLQKENVCPKKCLQILLSTKELIESQRDHYDDIWDGAQRKWAQCQNVTQTARRISHDLYSSDSQKQLFFEIIDQVLVHTTDRTITLEKCQFFHLVNLKRSLVGRAGPSDTLLKSISETFPKQFDCSRLKNECIVMSDNELNEIRDQPPNKIVESMRLHKLDESLTEVHKLLCLYLTLPSGPEPESSDCQSSASKRIQEFTRASQGSQRPSDLAFLSIEKRLLCQMKELPGFHAKVFNEYATQEHLVEFTFQ